MYNIIRINENKNGKSEILTACFNEEDDVEKFLNERFKIDKDIAFQTYLRLRKEVNTGINETLTVIETDSSISVEHKIGEQTIQWNYVIREADYTKSECTHYRSGAKYSTTYKATKETKE